MSERLNWLTEEEQNYLYATGYSEVENALIAKIEEKDQRAVEIYNKIKDKLIYTSRLELAIKENFK